MTILFFSEPTSIRTLRIQFQKNPENSLNFFIWQIEQSGIIALTTFNKNSIMVLLTLEIRQKRDGFVKRQDDLTE